MLRVLFAVHAVITGAAGAVLVFAPEAIPRIVGIEIAPSSYLVCYLLAAAEFCIAVLSWGARALTDRNALRTTVIAFIVLHATSGSLEVKAFLAGVSGAIWGNVAARALAVTLFAYYGLRPARQ
jgi:hypothetical protein